MQVGRNFMSGSKNFWSDQRGLVAIEWVSIATVAFIAAVAIAGALLSGADNLGGAVANQMNATANELNGNTTQ
jgi:Flp pilus assembly pilin Flp